MNATALSAPYPSPLRNWDHFSWIRSKPRRDASLEGLPFSAAVVPYAGHALMGQPEAREKILAYQLLAHLSFTSVLELAFVNPVCSEIGLGETPVALTSSERNDAIRIYCDEGGHALFVELLASTVESHYGVSRAVVGAPHLEKRMRELLASTSGKLSPLLLRHLFVAISETLVTKLLRDIPYDPTVAPVVRAVIGDHAADEACHSVYFRWYFPRLWRTLSAREQAVAGEVLPELVWAFLGPDLALQAGILGAVGYSAGATTTILQDAYPSSRVAESVAQSARPTLEMFRAAGVFERAAAREAFRARGLLGENR